MRLLEESARELLRTGGPLTVPALAELAGVSRATAYRYFPNNDVVVFHATRKLPSNPLDDDTWGLSTPVAPDGLGARAADLVRVTGAWAFDNETVLRTFLRLSLDGPRENGALRRAGTSRGRWIANLLEGLPKDVRPEARDRLAKALIPLFGSDAIVWTTDMAELSRDEAIDLLAWMAQVLVEATVAGS
jgi:AcrR family transcriptional regulator